MPGMRGQKLIAPRLHARNPWTWVDGAPARLATRSAPALPSRARSPPLLVYDYGVKWNILRHLVRAGFEPVCVLLLFFTARCVRNSGAKAVFSFNGRATATLDREAAIIAELMKGNAGNRHLRLEHQIIARPLAPGRTAQVRPTTAATTPSRIW